ncbi:hypothetical protein V6N13_038631 [Hibiscus sabdariffa]|uniref:Uncharacterized protein n=2 Tax=Hibiscus sabdariffa TaxID=183260 RepID=A0ABR2B5J9_9ROSI
MDERMREAAQTGSIDALYQLIKEDPCVLERIDNVPFLDTPLHVAACAERVDFMMEMLNLKPSFATRLNQDGSSPMHLALKSNRTQAVLRLLKFDEGLVRVKGREGLTPLHHVVQTGEVDILIKFLEACPEAIEDMTVRGETVFHLAAKNDMFDALEVLVGWLVRSRHEAAQRWEQELPSWADIEGNTVLHIAAIKNSSQMVKLLLEHNFRDHINAKNLEGLTALDMLRKLHGNTIEDMVRKAGGLSGSLIPNKSISSVDIKSLRKKITCFQKVSTVLSRGRKGISNEMRSTFLVVTVLIITATYEAFLNPPDKPDNKCSPSFPSKAETPTFPSFPSMAETPSFPSVARTPSFTSMARTPSFASVAEPPPFTSVARTPSFPSVAEPPSFTSMAPTPSFPSVAEPPSFTSMAPTPSVAEPPSFPSIAPTPSFTSADETPTEIYLVLRDVYGMFWLYNTLTFWAAICLTAYLLPSRSICLFLLITLSLFGICYLLLATYYTRGLGGGLKFLNYCLSTILVLFVLFRIARYIRRRGENGETPLHYLCKVENKHSLLDRFMQACPKRIGDVTVQIALFCILQLKRTEHLLFKSYFDHLEGSGEQT